MRDAVKILFLVKDLKTQRLPQILRASQTESSSGAAELHRGRRISQTPIRSEEAKGYKHIWTEGCRSRLAAESDSLVQTGQHQRFKPFVLSTSNAELDKVFATNLVQNALNYSFCRGVAIF